ncbi:MAG: M48 family metalloprotease [Candidatus Baltobacteraceae bacterium]
MAGFTRPLFFVWAASQIALLLWLWSSGNAARLRFFLARRVRSPIALRFVYGAAIAFGAQLAAFPANFAAYRIAVGFGLTGEGPWGWVGQTALDAFLVAVAFGAVAAFILSLVARTRLWYVYAVGGLFAAALGTSFFAPLVIAPLFDRMRPLAAQDPIAVEIRPLERRAGLASAPIYVDDLAGTRAVASADVSGFGPTERIVLAQTLVRAATPAEIAFVTAHELGHYVYRDDFRLALWGTLLFVISVLVAVTLADRIGFRYDDDPLSRLALVGAVLGAVALAAFPAYNAVERRIEAHADRYALAITGDRSAAVRTFVRYADETLTPLCPSAFERVYFESHPPLGSRIAFALHEPDPCPRLLGKR